MKLQNELSGAVIRFSRIADQIPGYADRLKAQGGYNQFETRLAWDCLRTVYTSAEICAFYDKYACTDEHITTLAKAALREVYKV